MGWDELVMVEALPLKSSAKFVATILASYSSQDGYAYCSLARLSSKTGMARSTVQAAVNSLVADGWMTIEPRYSRGQRRADNGYQLDLDKWKVFQGHVPGAGTSIYREPVHHVPGAGTPTREDRRRSREERTPRTLRGAPDDPTKDADEPPAKGADRSRSKSREDLGESVNELTAFGLASALRRALKDRGQVGPDPVNVRKLAHTFARWHRDGMAYEDMKGMVELFAVAPERYSYGDAPAWTQFLAAREKLATDMNKYRVASGTQVYTDPYADAR